MTTRASQILVVITAFFLGLVVFLGIFLYATGQLGGLSEHHQLHATENRREGHA